MGMGLATVEGGGRAAEPNLARPEWVPVIVFAQHRSLLPAVLEGRHRFVLPREIACFIEPKWDSTICG
jgi:hypothetical protein